MSKAIVEMKKRPFSDLNEEEYKKRYKKLKTFLKTGEVLIGQARKCKHQLKKDGKGVICVNPYTGGQYPCGFVGTENLCGFMEEAING